LQRLIEGDSNKCILRKIDIAEATVKVHVKAILRKIRVQNRAQAAIWGMNHGWPETPNVASAHLSLDMKKRPAAQAGEVSEIERIGPLPLGMIDHEAGQFELARANGFLRKEISGRTAGVRLRK
jgi:hypothetical protein